MQNIQKQIISDELAAELKVLLANNLHIRFGSKLTRKQLTVGDVKRLNKLVGLHKKLTNNQPVQSRTLETWLTPPEFEQLKQKWQDAKGFFIDAYSNKPDELANYETLLRDALFSWNRAESLGAKGKKESALKLRRESEKKFEGALEYLVEQLAIDPSLQQHIDRDVDWSSSGTLSLDPIGMPRLRTSRSPHTQSSITKRTIQDNKLDAVESAIFELAFTAQPKR